MGTLVFRQVLGLERALASRIFDAKDELYHVSATGGGRTDFAPLDNVEDRLLAYLRTQHHRVSQERVVSGPSLQLIYEVVADVQQNAVPLLNDCHRPALKKGVSRKDAFKRRCNRYPSYNSCMKRPACTAPQLLFANNITVCINAA
jgi:glucokinase